MQKKALRVSKTHKGIFILFLPGLSKIIGRYQTGFVKEGKRAKKCFLCQNSILFKFTKTCRNVVICYYEYYAWKFPIECEKTYFKTHLSGKTFWHIYYTRNIGQTWLRLVHASLDKSILGKWTILCKKTRKLQLKQEHIYKTRLKFHAFMFLWRKNTCILRLTTPPPFQICLRYFSCFLNVINHYFINFITV